MKARGRRLRASLGDSAHLRSLARRSAAAALAAAADTPPPPTWGEEGGEDGETGEDGEDGEAARKGGRGEKQDHADPNPGESSVVAQAQAQGGIAQGGIAQHQQVQELPSHTSGMTILHGHAKGGYDVCDSERSRKGQRFMMRAGVSRGSSSGGGSSSSAAAAALGMTRGELEGVRFVTLLHGVKEDAWVHALGAAVLTKGLVHSARNGSGDANATQSSSSGADSAGVAGSSGDGNGGAAGFITLRFRLAQRKEDRQGALVGQRVRLDIRLPRRPALPSCTPAAAAPAAAAAASGPCVPPSSHGTCTGAQPARFSPPASQRPDSPVASCSALQSPCAALLSAPLLASLHPAAAGASPPVLHSLSLAALEIASEDCGVANGGVNSDVSNGGVEGSGGCRGQSTMAAGEGESMGGKRMGVGVAVADGMHSEQQGGSTSDGMNSTRRRTGSLTGRQVDLSPRYIHDSPSPSPNATRREGAVKGGRGDEWGKRGKEGRDGEFKDGSTQRMHGRGGGIPDMWRKVVGERQQGNRKGEAERSVTGGASGIVQNSLQESLQGAASVLHHKQDLADRRTAHSAIPLARRKKLAGRKGVDVTRVWEYRGSGSVTGTKPLVSFENWAVLEESVDENDMEWFS
ncbi:unnamed protein product [Closterium sp. Naga37s-1]|nr:unnamed protein product [Closterium sp. Naga37s-1]